jgi:F0F1-type ATP synthase assembly protein I
MCIIYAWIWFKDYYVGRKPVTYAMIFLVLALVSGFFMIREKDLTLVVCFGVSVYGFIVNLPI